METVTAFVIGSAVLCLLEFALWIAFRRKAELLQFPRDTDVSFFRLLTVGRLRVAAVLHTVLMMFILGFILFFLW